MTDLHFNWYSDSDIREPISKTQNIHNFCGQAIQGLLEGYKVRVLECREA